MAGPTNDWPRHDNGRLKWDRYEGLQYWRSPCPGGQANSGAIEPAAATPQEASGSASTAREASAVEPSAEVRFGIAHLEQQQNTGHSKKILHNLARSFLNEQIKRFGEARGGQAQCVPIGDRDWPTWRAYIATHESAAQLLGTIGVKAICIEEIEGTFDPNRKGAPLVDIVVYNADGVRMRLHPGTNPCNDAKIIVRESSGGAYEPAAWAHLYRYPPPVYTQEYADNVPQGDRMEPARMFGKLQRLPRGRPWELTQATVEQFPWWLWLPTVGGFSAKVAGPGIERVALMETWTTRYGQAGCWDAARFLIVLADHTALLLDAAVGGEGHGSYQYRELEMDSPDYAWWVNWWR